MSDVVDLDARRPAATPYRKCECGCLHFRLVPLRLENGTHVSGATLVNEDNTLGGYSGLLICDSCFKELDTGVRDLPPMPWTSEPS